MATNKYSPALGSAHLGQIDMKVSNRVTFELFPAWFLVALHFRQPADSMPIQATMQGRACQVWDGCLQSIETIIQRQQRMPAKCHDGGLLLQRQYGGVRMLRTGWQIGHRAPLPPLGHRLGIDPMPTRQGPQALLTMLYRSTDRLRRCGAPVQNLSRSASFHLMDKNAPSNAGTKQLVHRSVTQISVSMDA